LSEQVRRIGGVRQVVVSGKKWDGKGKGVGYQKGYRDRTEKLRMGGIISEGVCSCPGKGREFRGGGQTPDGNESNPIRGLKKTVRRGGNDRKCFGSEGRKTERKIGRKEKFTKGGETKSEGIHIGTCCSSSGQGKTWN